MADKAVSELIEAERITATDLFVLEQNGTAKKLTGQILLNWLTAAADGHGGIQSITKLQATMGVQSLVDTYRITLADTTTFDFMVTNGRGIASIQKTATEDLVDTYTITYNDGTTDTFPVKNGAKGDKGDNAYVWIKYASTEPTEESHSFGSLPDDWIGIYFGPLAEAPADWKEYAWYQIKGEKGDTGSPATLISSSVTYQVGDSGSIIPSGIWSETVAVVPQGKYLWTRVVHQFNTGDPVTSYSVSRMGLDGAGSVSSVAGITPNADGNVPLKASDVGALPSAGGDMTGGLNMNGQKISGLNEPTDSDEVANKGYVDTNKVDKSRVVNNFTTEEEGFVADARALKVLNDSKLSMELRWKNASPTSAFPAQLILLDLSGGSFIRVVSSYNGTMYYTNDIPNINGKILHAFYIGVDTDIKVYREVEIRDNSLYFYDGIQANEVNNSRMIPIEIYIIKGVST